MPTSDKDIMLRPPRDEEKIKKERQMVDEYLKQKEQGIESPDVTYPEEPEPKEPEYVTSKHVIGPVSVNVTRCLDEDKKVEKDAHKRVNNFISEILPAAISKIRSVGLSKVLDGLTVSISAGDLIDQVISGLPGGSYWAHGDALILFMSGCSGDKTFIHELGHRFWYRFLPTRARQYWADAFNKRTVKIKDEDIDLFYEKYIKGKSSKEWPNKKGIISEDDIVLESKFLELASHVSSWSTDYKNKEILKKYVNTPVLVGERITTYAATKPEEAFADSFSLYISKGPRALSPWTRDFFLRISRSGESKMSKILRKLIKIANTLDKKGLYYLSSDIDAMLLRVAMDANKARELLGVGPDATTDEIKKVYKNLAIKHHPDKGGDSSTMQEINVARDFLLGDIYDFDKEDEDEESYMDKVANTMWMIFDTEYKEIPHLYRMLSRSKTEEDKSELKRRINDKIKELHEMREKFKLSLTDKNLDVEQYNELKEYYDTYVKEIKLEREKIPERAKNELLVLNEEEYGYRYLYWFPKMSSGEFEKWWSSLTCLNDIYLNPEGNLPGDLLQAYDDYLWYNMRDSKEFYTSHLHMEEDSFLVRPDGTPVENKAFDDIRKQQEKEREEWREKRDSNDN
jgi:hypothetical protein